MGFGIGGGSTVQAVIVVSRGLSAIHRGQVAVGIVSIGVAPVVGYVAYDVVVKSGCVDDVVGLIKKR
jgi:hypothetical protein